MNRPPQTRPARSAAAPAAPASHVRLSLPLLAQEHKSPAFLAKNPLGQLPAFEDGELLLTESGAILLYLGEKYGAGSPLAVDSTLKRVSLVKWLLLANSTLCEDLTKRSGRALDTLELLLAKQDYVAGPQFTLADISVAVYLAWIPYFTKSDFDFKDWQTKWPAVGAYLQRCMERPAAKASVPLEWLDDPAAWLV